MKVYKKLIMKLSKKSIINVHPLTFIYIILSFIAGRIGIYLISLLIVVIHEMAHYFMARYFCFEIDKIEILPFGAYLLLKDMHLHDIKEELCVVMAGPATHLFLYYIILFLFNGYFEEYLLTFNSFIFIFNMLPIYPMDGHRIISLFLQKVYDIKKALYLSLKISIFCFCLLSLFYFELETLVIIIYLLQCQFQYFKDIPNQLRYIYSHINTQSEFNKNIINNKFIYRRGYRNYYLIDDKLYSENEAQFILLKKVKNI